MMTRKMISELLQIQTGEYTHENILYKIISMQNCLRDNPLVIMQIIDPLN